MALPALVMLVAAVVAVLPELGWVAGWGFGLVVLVLVLEKAE